MAIVVLTLLAVVSILLSGIPLIAKPFFALAAAGYGCWALYRHLKSGIVRVARGESGWLVVDASGAERAVELIDHVRRGFLLVLSFRQERVRNRFMVLSPDNSDAELRRRLILILATSNVGRDSSTPS